MFDGIKTLDDYDFAGKTVLLRLDLNSPIDPKTGEFLDDRRFVSHRDTILELLNKGAKLVCLAHQGRPGEADFTTLEKHAKTLGDIIGKKVEYVDSLMSTDTLERIKRMKSGDIILLENTRFYSEEVLKRPADVQATTFLVKKLKQAADVFVNDGFAVSHRSQPSVVGFAQVMNAVAGRLVEKEVKTITNLLKSPKKPVVFVLGGTKADDSIKVAKRALEHGVDIILTGGVVGNIFLAAKDYRLGEPNIEFIRGKKLVEQIDIAKEMLQQYGKRIITPKDVALEQDGERVEIPVGELPQNYLISDIGQKTIDDYRKTINEAGTIFMNGALGIFEKEKFGKGTSEIIQAIADAKGYSVIGGGHTTAAADKLDVKDKIDHISSGGGACVDMLAGYELPGVEALRKNGK